MGHWIRIEESSILVLGDEIEILYSFWFYVWERRIRMTYETKVRDEEIFFSLKILIYGMNKAVMSDDV